MVDRAEPDAKLANLIWVVLLQTAHLWAFNSIPVFLGKLSIVVNVQGWTLRKEPIILERGVNGFNGQIKAVQS